MAEFAEHSDLIYNALVTTRSLSEVSEFKRSGTLTESGRGDLARCRKLMKSVSKGHALIQTREEKMSPDLASIQAYRYTYEALARTGLLGPNETIGTVVDRIAAILQAILEGTPPQIGGAELSWLEEMLAAIARTFSDHTASAAQSPYPQDYLHLP